MEREIIKQNFIDADFIEKTLENAQNTGDDEIDRILDKAAMMTGLTLDEAAVLLMSESETHKKRIFETANKIKKHIYGNRIVMFAPLYVSDYCVNRCSYCSFNHSHNFKRHKLSMEELKNEVRCLEEMGHKRILLEAGEDSVNCPIEYILECMKTIYEMKFKNGEIRRINVDIAATSVENYKKLKDAGIGTYILFQETYHAPCYRKYHLAGPKADYDYHTTAFDRAIQAGIDDVGAGVLFGLYKPHFEVLALLLHNQHLEKTYGIGFHTVSVPRVRKAEGAETSEYKYAVDDETFKKLVAVIRLSIPFTGIIISTRENHQMRKELIHLGISQMSAGSSVDVGGYCKRKGAAKQFNIEDTATSLDIAKWLIDEDLVPSFCTACYRSGRTGDRFMALAKSGNIKNICHPNSLMTLCEYMCDYGDEEFRQKAEKLISKEILQIEDKKIRELVTKNIKRIKSGERDLFI